MTSIKKLDIQKSTVLPHCRQASFDTFERICLRSLLLVDESQSEAKSKETRVDESSQGLVSHIEKQVDENILFQVPCSVQQDVPSRPSRAFHGRHEKKILGLWKAYDDGVLSAVMQRSRNSPRHRRHPSKAKTELAADEGIQSSSHGDIYSPTTGTKAQPSGDSDGLSSWGEEDGGFIHYNAWEVLKDEYANDFGFDYEETQHSIMATLEGGEEGTLGHVFRILGTSADDASSQPHVLSPPLMESLLTFVPDAISTDNFWMKFSLIRDGASLYTLKQYVKASPYTMLAVETTKGQVFGAFTSHTWKNHPSSYGGEPSFLWRMRFNRRIPCSSLYEQAQMEATIDVFTSRGDNEMYQVCDDSRIAIGGGDLPVLKTESGSCCFEQCAHSNISDPGQAGPLLEGTNFGFGIALDSDLRTGTTSQCGTFRSPCLINNKSRGEVFQVANLEVWTFTPCMDVTSAERIEMTRYFAREAPQKFSMRTGTS